MRNLYLTNKYLTIIGVGVTLTMWGGIIALPLLGFTQLIMCIIIFNKKNKLNKKNKKLFYTYLLVTPTLAIVFKLVSVFSRIETLLLLFIWMLVSSILAFFHLYITYMIKKQNGV